MSDIIYRQYDSRWGKLPYPTARYTFANNGCGCCSVANILVEIPKYKKITPKPVRKYMVEQDFATEGHGTKHVGITKTLQHYGLDPEMHETMKDAFAALDQIPKGRRAGILLFRGGTKNGVTWTSSGHYVAFTDYKLVKGKHYFYMKDSGLRNNDGWYCYEDHMKGLIKEVWTVKLPAPKKGKYYDVGKIYTVVSGVNVRTGGSMRYRKVGHLKKGTKVECLQTSKNGRWIKHGTFRWSCGRTAGRKVFIK